MRKLPLTKIRLQDQHSPLQKRPEGNWEESTFAETPGTVTRRKYKTAN